MMSRLFIATGLLLGLGATGLGQFDPQPEVVRVVPRAAFAAPSPAVLVSHPAIHLPYQGCTLVVPVPVLKPADI